MTRIHDPDWSPDGARIAFTGETNTGFTSGTYTVKLDGSGLKRITRAPPSWEDRSPRWSPDGKTLLFIRHNRIYTVKSSGGGLRRLLTTPAGESLTSVSWSRRDIRLRTPMGKIHIYDLASHRDRIRDLEPCRGAASCSHLDW